MSIAFPLICASLFYAFLALIGRAVIGLLSSEEVSEVEFHALAPVVGLSVLTLVTTYLVKANVPLAKVSATMTVAISLLSVIAIQVVHTRQPRLKSIPLLSTDYLAPFLVTAILISAPFIIGGQQFSILRGNGSDAFNYVTMADALSRYPIHWLLSQPQDILENYGPSLPFAQHLLQSRWSTSALLAFTSVATGISPIEFEYAFMLALMLVFFNALVGALFATGSLTKVTAWIPAAFVVGFWGQYILDISALSQITALPIATMLLSWLLSPTNETSPLFRYGVFITAILLVALFFEYPEILIAYLVAASLIFIARAWIVYRTNSSLRVLGRSILICFIFVFLLSAPLIRFIVGFAHAQTTFATSKTLGWERAYFSWMKNPIRGVWGGGPDLKIGVTIDALFTLLASAVGLVLTIFALVRLVKIFRNYRRLETNFPEAGTLFLAVSGIVGSALLLAKGNPWSAGKIMSFFVILIPIALSVWLIRSSNQSKAKPDASFIFRIFTISVFGWVGMNVLFAGGRIVHAADGTDFGNYIAGHGEYRRVSAEQISKIPVFSCPLNSRVAIFDPSDWGREYRTNLVDGNGFFAITTPYSQIRSNEQNIDIARQSFDCVFASKNYFDSDDIFHEMSGDQIFSTSTGKNFVALVGMNGGYGAETDTTTATRFAFAGNQDIRLTVVGRTLKYEMILKFCPGAPRHSNDPISIFIESGGNRIAEFKLTDCVEKNLELPGRTEGFTQQIRISSNDSRVGPTLIGADPRDLRLRVDAIGVHLP